MNQVPVSRRARLTVLMAIFALFATACGGGGGDAESTASPSESESAEAEASEEQAEPVTLTWGGSQASSSVMGYLAAQARLAGDEDGNMTINVRETNSSEENLRLVTDGSADLGISAFDTVRKAVQGLDDYEAEPFDNLRLLMVYWGAADFFIVREDAGIESLEDLDGKPFAAGFQGSGTAARVKDMLDFLDIHPDYFEGSLEDLNDATKDGRIVGFVKGGNGMKADAGMLDVASSVPVKLLGFSDDQVEKLEGSGLPLTFGEAPAGVLPGSEAITTPTSISVLFVDESMDEDVAYRLVKAIFATIEQASTESNYEATKGHKPEESTAIQEEIPIHPGALRYFEEVGAA